MVDPTISRILQIIHRNRRATSHRSRLGLIPLDALFSHGNDVLVFQEEPNASDSDNPFETALHHPQVVTLPQRRPGPENPQWKISPSEWPTVLRRVDQGETLRKVANDYNVSHEAVRRVVRAARKGRAK